MILACVYKTYQLDNIRPITLFFKSLISAFVENILSSVGAMETLLEVITCSQTTNMKFAFTKTDPKNTIIMNMI